MIRSYRSLISTASKVLFIFVAMNGAAEELPPGMIAEIADSWNPEERVDGRIRCEWRIHDRVGLHGSVSGRGIVFVWRTFADGRGIDKGVIGLATPIGEAGAFTAEGLYRELWLPEPQGDTDLACFEESGYRLDRSTENMTRMGLSVRMAPGFSEASLVLDPDDYALAGIHARIPLAILGELTILSTLSRIYGSETSSGWFLPAGGTVPDDLLYLGGRWNFSVGPVRSACTGVLQVASDAPAGGVVGGCLSLSTSILSGTAHCVGVFGEYRLPDGDLSSMAGHWLITCELIPRMSVSPYVRYVGHLDRSSDHPGLRRQSSHAWGAGVTLEAGRVTGRLEYSGELSMGSRGDLELNHVVESRVAFSGAYSGVAGEFEYEWSNVLEPVLAVDLEAKLLLGPFEPSFDVRIAHTGRIGSDAYFGGEYFGGVKRSAPQWFFFGRAGLTIGFGPIEASIRIESAKPLPVPKVESEEHDTEFFDLFDLTVSIAVESPDPP